MMRRGELAQYPPAELLRVAASERLTGGLEFDGEVAVCVYLEEGDVYLAARTDAEVALTVHDELDDTAYEAARLSDESRLRAATVGVVQSVLDRRDGWYFFHALTDHPAQGLWAWSVEDLLVEARPEEGPGTKGGVDGRAPTRAPADGDQPPSAGPPQAAGQRASTDGAPEQRGQVEPSERADDGAARWRLDPALAVDGLDPSSWAVVVAMAGTVSHDELVARLGWSAEQAHIAIGSLTSRGVLVPASAGPTDEILTGRVRRLDDESRPAG